MPRQSAAGNLLYINLGLIKAEYLTVPDFFSFIFTLLKEYVLKSRLLFFLVTYICILLFIEQLVLNDACSDWKYQIYQ